MFKLLSHNVSVDMLKSVFEFQIKCSFWL